MRNIRLPSCFENEEGEGKIFLQTKNVIYWANSQGYMTRTFLKSYKEHYIKPYLDRGVLIVKIAGKVYKFKHIIAECFIPNFKRGLYIVCKDGNEQNCSVDNLILRTHQEIGKATGYLSKSKPVSVIDKNNTIQKYRSIRSAAKALYCSYQTILDYINGKTKNGILNGYSIKFI